MYKTIWNIIDDDCTTKLTFYHFGKEPKFPSWYMEENKVYNIVMVWNLKLVFNLKIFFKCLTHFYMIHSEEKR